MFIFEFEGGFVVQTIGVRWVFILLTCLGGGSAVFGIYALEETYAPVLRARLELRQKGDVEAGEKGIQVQEPPKQSLAKALRENLSRPLVLLTRSLICFMLSLYMAL